DAAEQLLRKSPLTTGQGALLRCALISRAMEPDFAIPDLSGAVLLTQAGQEVLRASGGIAQPATGAPCTPETRFRIASLSKQFTAAAAMLLVQDGVLSLEQPIADLLEVCPAAWSGITLHHLLSCSSGLCHWEALPGFDMHNPGTPDEFVDRLAKQPLLCAPGEEWNYSSPGFVIAALALQRVTGRPHHEFLAERIFEPLGMTSTGAGATVPAAGVSGTRGGVVVATPATADFPGAGDLSSTVHDLARYFAALDAGTLLSEESKRAIRTAHVPVPEAAGSDRLRLTAVGYGYGTFVGRMGGRPAHYHPGDVDGFRGLTLHVPALRAAVLVLSNRSEADVEEIAAQLLPYLPSGS
ncbi:hypothetical protein DN069_38020, partial [Streptacidiphilus pinicola]